MIIPIYIYIAIIAGIISIIMSFFFARKVLKADPGNPKMIEVAGYIESGAKTFIRRQYTTLAIFVAVLSIAILFIPSGIDEKTRIYKFMNWEQSFTYIIGAIASMWAGWFGMRIGVKANTRAAQACTKGTKEGFSVAFFGGAVMGLAVVGVALLGVSLIYMIIPDPKAVLGFSFGASSVALFAKCGGGIYTKTADVGADLVGKREYKLPEDDPKNPASIADNVGDNVGDIAGMGSDLLDSYVASIVAAMILATALVLGPSMPLFILLPIILCGVGLISSLMGIYFLKWRGYEAPGKALNFGTLFATIIFTMLAAIMILIMSIGQEMFVIARLWRIYICTIVGLASGIIIGLTSNYYTSDERRPTQRIAHAAQDGDAIVILSGFAYGLMSIVAPAIGIILAMTFAYLLDGIFGVSMAAVGMLAIVGTIVANDAYGPIVDNARGIAEHGGLGEEVIRRADWLDSAGNTSKAITKGFAIGAANLTVVALMFSFTEEANIEGVDLMSLNVLIGVFIGIISPAIFSALLILAVQRNAGKMVEEIRRQFEENPKILTGEEAADFNKCIDIATKGALKELILPSIISIVIPLGVGLVFGVVALGAFLVGSIFSGFVFAVFMSNAGGSWDNAKKWIEDGHIGGKGTLAHKAAITGDTVGDPLKDTAGPSINTLLVVMSLTASIFIGFLLLFNGGAGLIGIFL
jgi:K(+)-stimulated pyrophosphate-energized sodium pump